LRVTIHAKNAVAQRHRTNHYSRIVLQNANAVSDETFMAGTLEINEHVMEAMFD